jgi:[ribosomal protein S5]-alanine N-acetyltransferase
MQASTDVSNTAMRAVLERLGFRLEGVMRGYGATSTGARIDGAMYAILKTEWAARQGPQRADANPSRPPAYAAYRP